jgi:hypothetical protein
MRKHLLILLAALLLTAAGTVLLAWQGAPRKAQVVQKTMVVPGNQAFTNASLTIGPSDLVTITATGQVYFSNGAQPSGVSPSGWPRNTYGNSWPDDYNQCEDPIPNVAHAALIADVNGEKFYVGPNKTFSGKDGLLYLGINDCTFTGAYRNTNQFSVNITVRRNAALHQ